MFWYLVSVYIFGAIAAFMATFKQRSMWFWMICCVAFPPALLILWALPPRGKTLMEEFDEIDRAFRDDNV
jgi:hypothetical protein